MEESFDSDQSEDNRIFNQKATQPLDKPQLAYHRMTRIGTKKRLKEQFTSNHVPLRFQRFSMKDPSQHGQAYRRQVTRQTVYEHRRNTQLSRTKELEMTIEERTMVYFLVNLILYRQFNVANACIKRHFIPMKQCSNLFKGNIRRLQALSLFRMFQEESQKQ